MWHAIKSVARQNIQTKVGNNIFCVQNKTNRYQTLITIYNKLVVLISPTNSEDTVKRMIKSLKSNTSTGLDGIKISIMKSLINEITPTTKKQNFRNRKFSKRSVRKMETVRI